MFTTLFTLGRDAELRYTTNNMAVLNCALAYNYGQKGQDGKKPTQWLDAALWGKQAEALAQYMTKGTKIVGSVTDLHVETFNRNDETMGAKLVGTLQTVILAGSPPQAQQQAPQQQAAPQRQQQAPARQAPARQQQAAPSGVSYDDDDIPF